MDFEGAAVSVHYKDRMSEIRLNFDLTGNMAHRHQEVVSLALNLQAALNLATPPVGLRLRVAPGGEAVVCPLSVLVACPSYIATTFQGMSWFPLLEGGDDDIQTNNTPPTAAAGAAASPAASPAASIRPPEPPAQDPLLPPPLGSPLEHDLSFLTAGSAASPAEGCGRPLTAPPGDRSLGRSRPRPGRREGLGRPLSATPSDKSFGMRRLRPAKSEGFGRPVTALPSDHSGSGSPAWGGSPHGFRCEDTSQLDAAAAAATAGGGRRPSTAPAVGASGLRRQPSSNLSGSGRERGGFGERFGRGGDADTTADGLGEARTQNWPHGGAPSGSIGAGGAGRGRGGLPSECWV
eukprot:g11229.t1